MSENNYENIVTIKFAQAEQPKFEERRGKGYIEFGKNNNYPDYLLSLYNESPKHGAIVKGKATYIFGKGFDVTQKANTQGESWNTIVKKAILDDEIFSGYYIQLIYNLQGKIVEAYHIEYHKVRTNKSRSKFFIKDDWSDLREKPREYPAYTGKYDVNTPSVILFISQYNPKGDAYPLPNYFQGLNYIESDIQVSRHILGNAKDGFVATTLINLNGGEPQEAQKEAVEKGIKKKFTGSEGDRVVIMFNKSKDNAAEIIPLTSTMLTKEDFTNVNNLINQEIFSCHQVTSPMLFGIKTEGQLGGRSEIQDAYEIFNNTYVNERQQAHEENFNKIFNLVGIPGEHKITPVKPLGLTLTESALLKVMPREYFLDELGIDQKYYQLPATEGTATVTADPSGTVMAVNKNIKGLTGKEFQNIERIVKKYKKGNITKGQAAMLLKTGFDISDDQVELFLEDSTHQFSSQEEIDFELINQFGQVGEAKENFEELTRKPANEAMYFSEVQQLSQLESNVLNLIKKDKRITAEVIAKTLEQDVKVVARVMTEMVKSGVLSVSTYKQGQDEIIERTATDKKIDAPKASTTEILLRYYYAGPKDERNRPFCAKLLELDRVYSRADIETISERLGYSVWDRRGGWLTLPNGEHRPYCRHQWFALTVIRKK